MKAAVITGGTGVIGMALIEKCIEEKCFVTVLVNPDSKRVNRIPEHPYVRVVPCGLQDMAGYDEDDFRACWEEDYIRPDVFFHLAWSGTFGGDVRNNTALQEENYKYTLDAVELANRLGAECFVGVGSQAEYGRVEGTLSGSTPANPENEYGRCKLKAGIESRELCSKLGIRHIWTRVLSIYGPYDGENTMVMSTIRKLIEGVKPSFTQAEQMWDYLYASDAANALYLCGEAGRDGAVYPIGSGQVRQLKKYIEDIREVVDSDVELGFGEVPYADKQVMYLCADISELKKDTGFEPAVTFREGIARTVEWVRMS